MHLVGQHSNPSEPLEAVLDWAPDGSTEPRKLQKRCIAPGVPFRGRLGNGVVQAAVIKVLASADRPMRLAEVHASVERILGRPVSIESVSWSLRMGVRGEQPRLERISQRRYEILRPE